MGVFGANEYSVENVREELCASALIECQRQKKMRSSSTTAAGLGLKNNNNDSEPELIDEGVDDIITGKLLLNNNEDDLSDTRMVLNFDRLEGVNKLATSSSSAADVDADDTAATMTNDANFETTISSNNDPNHIQEGLRRRRRNNKGTADDIINNDDVANTSSKWTTTEEQQQQSNEEGESKNDNEQEKYHAVADPIQLFGVPPPALRMAQSYSRDALAYYVEVANLARQIMILVEKGE